jgi:hypothetical protein
MITDRLRVLALRLMANFTFLLTACDGDNASAEGCQSDGATTSIPSAQPTRAAQGLSSGKRSQAASTTIGLGPFGARPKKPQ